MATLLAFADSQPRSPLERDRRGEVAAYKLLTLEIELAILRNDQRAWASAMNRREQLGIDTCLVPELQTWRSPLRCECCSRLVGVSGQCEDATERAA